MNLQVVSIVLSALALLGVIAVGRGYSKAASRRGSDELDDRVIERYKEITAVQEEQIDELQAKVTELQQKVAHLSGRNQTLEGLFRFDKVPPAFLEAIEASANAHHSRTQTLFKEALSENIRIMANAVLDVGRIINEHNDKWNGEDRRVTEQGEG